MSKVTTIISFISAVSFSGFPVLAESIVGREFACLERHDNIQRNYYVTSDAVYISSKKISGPIDLTWTISGGHANGNVASDSPYAILGKIRFGVSYPIAYSITPKADWICPKANSNIANCALQTITARVSGSTLLLGNNYFFKPLKPSGTHFMWNGGYGDSFDHAINYEHHTELWTGYVLTANGDVEFRGFGEYKQLYRGHQLTQTRSILSTSERLGGERCYLVK